eukprot:535491_1
MSSIEQSQYKVFIYFLLNITMIQTVMISKYIGCIDIPGSYPSAPALNSPESTAICPQSYKLTSCGARGILDNELIQGTMIENANQCTVLSIPSEQEGVRAYARCCNLTQYTSSYSIITAPWSANTDDAISSKTCSINQQLIGCGGSVGNFGSNNQLFDGSYVESQTHIGNSAQPLDIVLNKCTAQNGIIGSGALTEGVCIQITNGYELNCVSIWGIPSNNGGTHTSSVACPTDKDNYFMTSCTAYSPFASMQQYLINSDICIVKDKGTNNYAYANAICCRITRNTTARPTTITLNPTQYPTKYPTKYPSQFPSKYPSEFPTKSPTKIPSLMPIKYPTFRPTFYASDTNNIDGEVVGKLETTVGIEELLTGNNDNGILIYILIMVAVICFGL